MDKNQFVRDIVTKVNAKEYCTQEEISTALSYFRELMENGQFSGNKLESNTFGGILAAALSKVSK